MIARQVPDDAHGTEVVLSAQVKNLLRDLCWCLVGVVVRHRPLARQPSLTLGFLGLAPSVEARATDPEVPTRPTDVSGQLCVLKDPQLAADLTLIVGHRRHPLSPQWRLSEVSR